MLGLVLAALASAILFALTGTYPPQSEDWNHLHNIAGFTSWKDAFDLRVSHSRPLQHLCLWWLMPEGMQHPAQLRVPSYVMNALIGGLVGALARALGASPRRALLATALFLCFPSVKGLSWIMAISTPGRVLFMLAALVAAALHAKRPRAATGVALLLAQVLAILMHQASCLLPAGVAMLVVAVSPRRWRALLDPWIAAHLALGAALVVLIASLPGEERHHGLASLGAILANGARALLSLVPELVRWPAIEGLRGAHGGLGRAFGFAACAVVAGGFALVLWRASPVVRALVLAAALDLVPPALTAGFVVRYASFAAALVAVALALSARPTRAWAAGLVLLGASWLWDQAVDVAEVREGGRLGIAVVAAAREVRAEAGPSAEIALLDPPGEVGAERDVTVFNWGLPRALEQNGVAGPWRFVRTKAYVTSSDVELVDEARLARLEAEGVRVRRWDVGTLRFVPR